jgi:FAD synthetase
LRTHIARELAAGRPSNFAFCLGTRQGDPNCKGQTAFAPSSAWMPPFMRVNPILDWDYGLVWQLLVGYELEYCALYDQGYTSLGTRDDTAPNPALLLPSGGGYLPAYALADYALERAGRQPSKPKDAAAKGTRAAGADCGASAAPAPPASAPAPSAALPGGRSPVESARTAGLVVIGDELLKGKVADTNAPHAIRAMRGKGLDVRRVALVRDELDEIAREVRAQSQALDLVVTSGGVGPTHDDVTLRAVAAAFDRPIERNEEMAEMIRRAYGGAPLSPAREKMALLPAGVRLRLPPPSESGEPSLWPIVQVENVFILPGVPDFFEAKLATILGHFVGDSRPAVHTRKLALSCAEDDIVRPLNEVVGAYGGLAFGSYPVSADECRTVVTIEGTDEAEVEAALLALTSKLSPDTIVRTPSKSLEQMLN